MSDTENTETVVEEVTEEVVKEVDTLEEQTEETQTEETTEEVKEDTQDDTSQLDDLKAQVDALSKTIDEKETEIQTLAAYKDAIESLLETKKQSIPAEFVDLLPAGDALIQINWITKAEGKGLFKKKDNPSVEIGSFVEIDTENTQKQRTDNLTARELLSLGAKGLFGK